MLCPTLRRCLYASAALLFLQSYARAVVLDWDTVVWTEGSTSGSYQTDVNDPNTGISINVTPSSGTPFAPFTGQTPNPMTPAVSSGFEGGFGSAQGALVIAVDLADAAQTITITISFAATGGASNVSFRLFDIDAGGGSQDQLTLISATSADGTTQIAPTITPGADNQLLGTGLSQSVLGQATTPNTGSTSGRGNVMIDFGTNQIQSLTFTFGSTSNFGSNPSYQHFGIHDINFTPVPEMNPALVSTLSCLLAAGLIVHRRRATRARSRTSSTVA